MRPRTPTGAHLRYRACRLIFLAAFLYLRDSTRSDEDIVDMPTNMRSGQPSLMREEAKQKMTYDLMNHLAITDPPYFWS